MDREDNSEGETNQQQTWDAFVENNREAAEEVLGFIERKNKSQGPAITKLLEKQKELGKHQVTVSESTGRINLRKERSKKLTGMHRKVKEKDHEKIIISQVGAIKNGKDDSYRMFQAMRALQTTTIKKPLIVGMQEVLTTDTRKQVQVISQLLNILFHKDNTLNIPNIPPTRMSAPFTTTDVRKAISQLREHKSTGIEQLKLEQVKKRPSTGNEDIAQICNIMAETREHPKEMKTGIFVLLQRPGKTKGPVENLRPIILRSLLWKIFVICLLEGASEKIDGSIPNTQGAYRKKTRHYRADVYNRIHGREGNYIVKLLNHPTDDGYEQGC